MPAITATDGEFAVVWREQAAWGSPAEIRLRRFSVHGRARGPEVILVWSSDEEIYEPRIASIEKRLALVWIHAQPVSSDSELWLSILSDAGEILVAPRQLNTSLAAASEPSVVGGGSVFAAAWTEEGGAAGRVLKFIVVDALGVSVCPEVAVDRDPGVSSSPTLVWSGTEFGLFWRRGSGQNTELYFASFDGAGNAVSGMRPVDADPNRLIDWTIVSGSNLNHFSVFWHDFGNSGGVDRFRFASVDRWGSLVAPVREIVGPERGDEAIGVHAVASQYSLVWGREGRLGFVVVDENGGPFGPSSVYAAPEPGYGAWSGRTASAGATVGVVWEGQVDIGRPFVGISEIGCDGSLNVVRSNVAKELPNSADTTFRGPVFPFTDPDRVLRLDPPLLFYQANPRETPMFLVKTSDSVQARIGLYSP